MVEVIFMIFFPIILSFILIALILKGRKGELRNQNGLWLIILGFSLILLGALIEISEYAIGGAPFLPNFSHKFFVLGGYLLLAMGLVRWLIAIYNLGETKANLQSELEQEILTRHRLEGELQDSQVTLEATKEDKQNFLVRISHEMRTPLNGVLGMTELLLETDLDNHQLRMAKIIKESGLILLNLINENLDFSSIEAGKLNLEDRTFNLRHKIEELIDLMAERAQAKNLEFNFKLQPNLPTEVRGDSLRLYQILFNLLGNAIKYTEAGEIFLSVRVFEEQEDRVTLHFAVRDTGIGIPPECREKIFQPFYRVDSPESRKYEGTGLGLAIAKELVEMMHGEIGIESELGKGSIFWFIIEMEKPSSTAQIDKASEVKLKELRIIVAENDHLHLQNLMRHLSALGLQAEHAFRGKQMLEILRGAAIRGKPYDLGLISMELPDLKALQLAHAIKSDWNLRETKLVLLTSFTDHKNVPSTPEAGIDAYLDKPVSAAKLSQCLATLLNWGQGVSDDKLKDNIEVIKTIKKFPYRVLVAEDNLVNQEVAKAMLESLGCQVEVVENGQKALVAVSRSPYDLVFMDCQMPEMDGYEATRAIRNLENENNSMTRIPIVALTAHTMEKDQEACRAAGMDDYLSKPFTKEQLENILEKWPEGTFYTKI